MSHLSKIFEEAPVKVQNRNGFDLSHTRTGTSKTGQLVPALCKLLPPNSTISLGVNMEVSLPPLATQFYGRVDAIVEGFVVPCSILYGGWKQFISNAENTQFPVNQATITSTTVNGFDEKYALPYWSIPTVISDAGGPGVANYNTLWATHDNVYEFLGFKGLSADGIADLDEGEGKISLLPALAYHKIVDTFYRNTKLTKTWFAVNPNVSTSSNLNKKNVSLIWHSFYANNIASGAGLTAQFTTTDQLTFPDGVSVFSTRQRNYTRDYFTSAVTSPQQGEASKLQFDTLTGTGEFTINALRMANALQKFKETNNLSGDYADMVRNRWGVRPIDADFDEPHYLGRVVVPVYQHSVYQSAQGQASAESSNPFIADGTVGAKGASGSFSGEGSICDKFNISCWSYVIALFSLVPHAQYSYGINRELTMVNLGDFPAPELQSVGMEEIKNYEIYLPADGSNFAGTFGYIPRYSRFKYQDDTVVGELAPTGTLHSFQLQRAFSSTPELGTAFLQINQTDLDDVFAVSTENMKLSCWYEIFFRFKVVMPLADFCIPTLGDIADTHTIKASVGGSRL